MTKQTKIEFKDLDEVTSADDLVVAINTRFGSLNIKKQAVTSIKKAYAGTQTETLSVPTESAKELLEAEKIEFSWVVAQEVLKQNAIVAVSEPYKEGSGNSWAKDKAELQPFGNAACTRQP
ncbi:hypothetical protein GQX74_011578 [Glossina fuscipes]|nr:hypothetical protein GQX74_011578 [Glossina fuscipes]